MIPTPPFARLPESSEPGGEAEHDLGNQAREHLLAIAIDILDLAVLIIGRDRRVVYANAAAVSEYGFTLPELQALPFSELVDATVLTGADRAGEHVAGRGVREVRQLHRRRDGTTFPASVLLRWIQDPANQPVAQLVTVRNVTHEYQVDEQGRQREKLAALGELVAGVAHELNNPLAGISAFAQLLLEEDLDPEQQESVRLIKREADRAVGVIRDLLLFSRKSGPALTLVDLNELLRLTLRLRGYALRSTGVDVQVELDPSLPPVSGDRERLQQVLLNILVNAEHALQHAPTRRIEVRSAATRDGVALVLRDTGVGMDEDTRRRIFEPFFTTKAAGEGTGLGLSVSYGIVRAHGGHITVASTPGGGTTFRIELPRAAEQASVASA